MHPLQDKVILITGGSSGIGRACALRFARHGAKVTVAARNRSALNAVVRETGTAQAVTTDVTDPEQCRQAVQAAVQAFGRLDVLLCCAGISMRAYFDSCELTALEQVMRVNFFGTLYTTHAALPHIQESKGSLVALSSLTGKRGVPSYAMYGASKFAIQGLYESLRLELGRDGVHVGVVSPGFVDTPLRHHVLGPKGEPWPQPPDPPFRIWPVEKCVDRIEHLLVKRRAEALLPAFCGPLLALDQMLGRWIGDWLLATKFPRV